MKALPYLLAAGLLGLAASAYASEEKAEKAHGSAPATTASGGHETASKSGPGMASSSLAPLDKSNQAPAHGKKGAGEVHWTYSGAGGPEFLGGGPGGRIRR